MPRTPTASIKILLVDDHLLLREGIRSLIANQPDIEVVGEAEDGVQAIDRFRALMPDIVLMDLQMPRMGGVDAVLAIRKDYPRARIIVLTTYPGDAQALRALKAGASGYLLKSTLRSELLDAIRSVHAGGKHLNAAVATDIAIHIIDDMPTERERTILQLASGGNSNRQIAARLALSEETVKGHMKSVFSKLNASDRTHAVAIAAKRGIIEL